MRKEIPSILNSALAVQALKKIADSKDGNYSTKIAEELDKPQPSISRVLNELYHLNFIDKGERSKSQKYRINYDGIAYYWYEQIDESLEETDKEKYLKQLRENKETLIHTNKEFTRKLLKSCEVKEQTCLKNILFNIYLSSLAENAVEKDNFLEKHQYLEPVKEGLVHYLKIEGHPEEFRDCLPETKE